MLNKYIAFGCVAGETIIQNTKTGSYFTLNNQGTELWNLYFKGKTISEIKQYFSEKYPESRSDISKDVDRFFDELRNNDIIAM